MKQCQGMTLGSSYIKIKDFLRKMRKVEVAKRGELFYALENDPIGKKIFT